jgi:RNA polymerase II subunit A small phosphatase-like protein
MADSVITQVSKPQISAPSEKKPLRLFSCLCFCRPSPVLDDEITPVLTQPPPPQFPGPGQRLLPPLRQEDAGRKCLVLDLDETLVHSSFKPVPDADFVIPIEIEGQTHQVYVLKRPHVDVFLKRLGELFELVLFTASLSKYADPVTDLLDKHKVLRHRLFREHCVNHRGNFVKDLSRLGREINQTIIVDNSPASYIFHPQNAVPIESWFEDKDDCELLELIPFLEEIAHASDISVLAR